ncbi:hypothetical protein ZWY2020_008464, partial [Hordeum vulgare]
MAISKCGQNSGLAVKKSKAEKDPNKLKRPPSAFFVFMDSKSRENNFFKHPDRGVVISTTSLNKIFKERRLSLWVSLSDLPFGIKPPYPARKKDYSKAPTLFVVSTAAGRTDQSRARSVGDDDGD